MHLKHTRLPIPPRPHETCYFTTFCAFRLEAFMIRRDFREIFSVRAQKR